MAHFPLTNSRNIEERSGVLGNRRSIHLSYEATGGFPRFPMVSGQSSTRKSRINGWNDMARKAAQAVPGLVWHIPVYENDKLIGHWDQDKFVPANVKPVVERIPVGQRRLRNRIREHEASVACYFIGGEDGPIKIGQTENLQRRLKAIQSHSPVVLSVLASTGGGAFAEMDYHIRFAEHRIHGEWFTRCPEIEAEIARLTPPLTNGGLCDPE